MAWQDKINRTLEVISYCKGISSRPVVLWSSGKDSMCLLHIIRTVYAQTPTVVCWREPWLPEKQRFTNRIIEEWDLNVIDYAPSYVRLCQDNDRIDVLNYYQTGPESSPEYIFLARGTERPEFGSSKRWICGLETFLSRPTGTFNFNFDLCYHGHKSVDIDPCAGNIPLELDVLKRPGASTLAYPLRHWTDSDVFSYIEQNGVPYDETRYAKDKTTGEWVSLPDKTFNPDYYHTCFKCCDPREQEFVQCPKTGLTINNIHERVRWETPKLSYCNLRTGKDDEQS